MPTQIAYPINLDLVQKLKDRVYRRKFFLAEASAKIAGQIIKLRKKRGFTQAQLAEEADTQQPAISRAERADYQNWSFNALRSIADALDARIRVLIEPAEDVLKEYENTGTEAASTIDSGGNISATDLFGFEQAIVPIEMSDLTRFVAQSGVYDIKRMITHGLNTSNVFAWSLFSSLDPQTRPQAEMEMQQMREQSAYLLEENRRLKAELALLRSKSEHEDNIFPGLNPSYGNQAKGTAN
jgi:transcriptional regulator with XRE-family HTH domain